MTSPLSTYNKVFLACIDWNFTSFPLIHESICRAIDWFLIFDKVSGALCTVSIDESNGT